MKKRRPGDILHGFFLLCHPVPVLFHLVAVTAFALLAAWPRIAWNTLLFVVAAHTAMQLSIAVLNDYCDRDLDAVSKRNKPIASGLVTAREALLCGHLLIILMLALLLPLNRLAMLLSLLYLALGISYNLGLKSTPFSGIVFALAIPLIPVYAFVGMNRLLPFLFWLIPVAALLGIALNLANSLPDLEEDALHNAHTLAVRFGAGVTFYACPILLLLAAGLTMLLTITHAVPARIRILAPTTLILCALTATMLFFFRPSSPPTLRKRYFYLIVASCLMLAAGWLISILV